MSRPFRQVPATSLSGSMVPPVGATPTFPVISNPYGVVNTVQQHFVPQQIVYTQPVPAVQAQIPMATGIHPNMPGIFVPVCQVPTSTYRPPVVDPAKLLEEQRRIEKERNFQMQQQRLKQFTIAGKKGSLNADNLIDSMFGKVQSKKTPSESNSIKVSKHNEELKNNISEISQAKVFQAEVKLEPTNNNFKKPSSSNLKDFKGLDTMMLECSNLDGPSKAKTFQKPSVKELPPSHHQTATFAPSTKSRDWRNIQGLDAVFSTPKPTFPAWCSKENVPAFCHQVENLVTNNGAHPPDTNLLFPILVSSGLSRENLGVIWELVNKTNPGHLTVEEMYAALALIAVAQAGHAVVSTDVLHQLPSCPVPKLQCFSNPQPPVQTELNNSIPTEAVCNNDTPPVEEQPPSSSHRVIRPTAIALGEVKHESSVKDVVADVEGSVESWTPFKTSGFVSSPDDEFDDFKSATPTAVNFILSTPVSETNNIEDEFGEFKQAEPLQAPEKEHTVSSESKPVIEDLMSPEEDKYSVFRALQQTENNSWGNFAQVDALSSNPDALSSNPLDNSISVASNSQPCDKKSGINNTTQTKSAEADDFGDFLQASVASTTPSITVQGDFVPNFADFAKFADSSNVFNATVSKPDSDDFGEFASIPVKSTMDPSQEFAFCHFKDNISLAESQSVSSLELGGFDGGFGNHSGESKSSMSRQGSIPSLDLKHSCPDGPEFDDEFGEMQSAFPQTASREKTPSPSGDNKPTTEKVVTSSSLPFTPVSTFPLIDRYSVIRAERKDEDPHITEWTRCIQSSVNILENAKRIFNQMSCSSVCNEVIGSEEGANYVKNVTEVYKVICRISLASKAAGKQTNKLLELLKQAEQTWNTVCGFLAGSSLMPEEAALDFSSGVLKADPENNTKACGLCLLNVDSRSKAFDREEDTFKLSYGGRNYHATCANLWVNCVDPLLPALSLPQLL